MHYYQHHIGDFIRDTSRLTDQQCMTYLRLIWLYYESEKPLPDNPASLALRVGSDEQTVLLILNAFFTQSGGNWIQMRCESEIRKFQKKADSARHANESRWSKTDSKTGLKSDLKTDTNQVSHQIPTNNQQPTTNISAPDGFDEFYKAYPKKVGKPAALKAFKSAKVNGHLPDLLADIGRRLANGEWSVDKHQFIPNPATYLNQRRWEDEQPQQSSAFLPGSI